MIHIYIIEDEPPAAAKLQLFLQRADAECKIEVFNNGEAAFASLQSQSLPDVLFTDIEMPGLSGIELLEQLLPDRRPLVVITSAYEKYALSGYRLNVIDYLLKPYTYDRLVEALNKVKEGLRLRALLRDADKASAGVATTLTIRTDLHTERIDTESIMYIEAVKDYVRIVTPARRMLTQQTLTSLEAQLPAECFLRIHRSFIVNIAHVTAFDSNSVTVTDGTVLTVGKTYKGKFNEIAQSLFKSK